MALIRKPYEIVGKKNIAAIIFGEAGHGKTTLACSAHNPVLFDFDNGVHRINVEAACDTVQLTSFDEAMAALQEVAQTNAQVAGTYQTIVVDTLSKLVDSAIRKICPNREPKVNDWMPIYAQVKTFIRTALGMGLHVVFTAQAVMKKTPEDDKSKWYPDCPDKIYNSMKADMDIIGYLHYVDNKGVESRTITFNPTSKNEGKNSADFSAMYGVNTIVNGQPFRDMSNYIDMYISNQSSKDERRRAMGEQVHGIVADFTAKAESCGNAEGVNALLEEWRNVPQVGDARIRCQQILYATATRLSLNYDANTDLYV